MYPAPGLSERLAETGQFPPLMTRKLGGRASAGLLIEAAVCLVLALGFKLDAIASIGSAVAPVIFTLITAAHLRIRSETGASLPILVLAIVAAAAVFVTFVFTTLIHEPASMVTLLGVLVAASHWTWAGSTSTPGRRKVELAERDTAAAQLARLYAAVIDQAADPAYALRHLGPLLLRALGELQATPAARPAAKPERSRPNQIERLRAAHVNSPAKRKRMGAV